MKLCCIADIHLIESNIFCDAEEVADRCQRFTADLLDCVIAFRTVFVGRQKFTTGQFKRTELTIKPPVDFLIPCVRTDKAVKDAIFLLFS